MFRLSCVSSCWEALKLSLLIITFRFYYPRNLMVFGKNWMELVFLGRVFSRSVRRDNWVRGWCDHFLAWKNNVLSISINYLWGFRIIENKDYILNTKAKKNIFSWKKTDVQGSGSFFLRKLKKKTEKLVCFFFFNKTKFFIF